MNRIIVEISAKYSDLLYMNKIHDIKGIKNILPEIL